MPEISSFDWKKGCWLTDRTTSHSQKTIANVCIAGDLAPIRSFKNAMETHLESIYGDLLSILKSAGLSIVNLESPFSDRREPVFKNGAVFKGKNCHIKTLKRVPSADGRVEEYRKLIDHIITSALARYNIE